MSTHPNTRLILDAINGTFLLRLGIRRGRMQAQMRARKTCMAEAAETKKCPQAATTKAEKF